MLKLYKMLLYLKIITETYFKEKYNTMNVATTIPRYDKNQILVIDNKEIKLIDHLKEIRSQKKITKKFISNLIKHNDYWYSQIERDGKKGDDNRQRTIYRTDLVNVISIIKYNAISSKDLEILKSKSEVYLDKIIKAIPLKESIKSLDLYQLDHIRTSEEQNRLLDSLLNTQEKILRRTFESLNDNKSKDLFLDALKNTNLALKIDPLFIIYLMGLPYADFLYEAKQEEIYSLFRDIISTIDNITQDTLNNDIKTASEYLGKIRKKIVEYTGKEFMDGEKKNYIINPSDKW